MFGLICDMYGVRGLVVETFQGSSECHVVLFDRHEEMLYHYRSPAMQLAPLS